MDRGIKQTVEYLRAPAKYFWHWADEGEVIEWEDGLTICYRDDLVYILRHFYCSKPPPLSAVLLVLAACNKNFESCGGKGILTGLVQTVKSYAAVRPELSEIQKLLVLLKEAFLFLDMISTLPDELKKGSARISLLQQVFSTEETDVSSASLKNIADELDSGRIDHFVFKKLFDITTDAFKKDLLYLSNALGKYRNADTLAFHLKTGLAAIPEATAIAIPDETNIDLFTALLQDKETAGIARLAQHLLAVINIPLHTQGNGDLPLGGISDITNRGNYDRLLLSELAYDDKLLAARLVNNEALFLRREEPPENPKLQRTLLLDTTIKMWGMPRVFAMAAALAISQNRKHRELIESYALSGKNYEPLTLHTKEGITAALGKLDHALEPGNALVNCIDDLASTDNNEFFFITEGSVLDSKSFYAKFSGVKERMNYVITVDHESELKFYSFRNGVSKLLSRVCIDTDKFFFTENTISSTETEQHYLPVFFDIYPMPLYLPVIRVNKTNLKQFAYISQKKCIVGINETQRLLMWGENNKGAKELLGYIEKGTYFFGYNAGIWLYVFVNGISNHNKLYKIHLVNDEVTLLENIPAMAVTEVDFFDENFLVYGKDEIFSIDYDTGEILSAFPSERSFEFVNTDGMLNIDTRNAHEISRSSWNNDSILFKIDRLHVNSGGELILGKHILRLLDSIHISLVNNSQRGDMNKIAEEVKEAFFSVSNPQLRLHKWRWKDGSEAVIDSRGLLHLKSSDPALPEITIAMVLSKAAVCYASDGNVCGSHYLTGVPGTNKIQADQFYYKYIRCFIDRLI